MMNREVTLQLQTYEAIADYFTIFFFTLDTIKRLVWKMGLGCSQTGDRNGGFFQNNCSGFMYSFDV